MSNTDIITRVYRDSVTQLSASGEAASRREAFEQSIPALMQLINSGEIQVDFYDYLLTQLKKVDEAEGSKADNIIAKAVAHGQLALFDTDLDVVVTLGKGRRKTWGLIRLEDLVEMDSIRHENMRQINHAYYKDWKPKFSLVYGVVEQYGTFGDAFKNGGFPPAALIAEVA